MKKKTVALLMACTMSLGCAIGGTLAWLTDSTDEVVNTFTDSDVSIDLTETTGDEYKMIPGWTIAKDPKVTVLAGSEDCYVFIKVEEQGGVVNINATELDMPMMTAFGDFIEYNLKLDDTDTEAVDGWKQLTDSDNKPVKDVYYQIVTGLTDENWTDYVLDGNYTVTDDQGNEITYNGIVKVKETVTKSMMDALEKAGEEYYPTLTFTAYATQLYKNNTETFTAAEAWEKVNSSN